MNYSRYIPLGLFFACSVKLLVNGFDLSSIGALAVLGAVSVLFEFKGSSKDISELKVLLKTLTEDQAALKKNHEDLKTHVAGLKMGRELRPFK